jgi:hypothetical protein
MRITVFGTRSPLDQMEQDGWYSAVFSTFLIEAKKVHRKNIYFDGLATLKDKRIWASWVPAIGESLDPHLRPVLDAVFEESAIEGAGPRKATGPMYITSLNPEEGGRRHTIQIANALECDDPTSVLAVGFEFEFECGSGCFKAPTGQEYIHRASDTWVQHIHFPLRMYQLDIEPSSDSSTYLTYSGGQDSVTVLGEANEREVAKISNHHRDGAISKEIRYPLVGAVYSLGWEVLPYPDKSAGSIVEHDIITSGGYPDGAPVRN